MTTNKGSKVCLLMHGQPRFIENPYALASHQNQILNKYNCDVICHVWHGGNLLGSASSWSGITDVEISDNSVNVIKDKLHPKIIKIDAPREFSLSHELEELLLARFRHENGWTKKNISNVISSLYSIEQVVEIAKTLDLSEYDFVILSRYDNLIYRLPDLNLLPKNKFYLSDHHSKFPDLIFIFSPKFLDAFSIYSKIENLIKDNLNIIWGPSMNEPLKMFSFESKYNLNLDSKAISLPVRVVRDDEGRGDISMLEIYSLTPKEFLIDWKSIKDIHTYIYIKFKGSFGFISHLRFMSHLFHFWKKVKNCRRF